MAQRAHSAFVDGFHVALIAAAVCVALAAGAVAALLPRRDADVLG